MDAVRARALSLLESLASINDPRNSRDLGSINGLALFCTKYNATSERVLTITPSTQDEHTTCFFAALDIISAVTGIGFMNRYNGYTPNAQVISILAREDMPYTISDYRMALRIRHEVQAGSNYTRFTAPYPENQTVVPPGYFNRAAGAGHVAYPVTYNTIEVPMNGGERHDYTRHIRPGAAGLTRYVISWRGYLRFTGHNNAMVDGSVNLRVLKNAATPLRAGELHEITPNQTLTIHNTNANLPAIVSITCHEYSVAGHTNHVYPGMEADLAAVYSYLDADWHALRTYIMVESNLPPHHPPIEAIDTEEQVLAIALTGRLYDVYIAHQPRLIAVAAQGRGRQGRQAAIVNAMGAP
ncbi:VP7 protein [Corriparta virus]|uniref:Core protein VP7 n=1 Tax=Corriparta virus TaxID=40053 RepID=T1SQP1_9REOV|nr:VP7 protein [Corriparta virus]AGT51061.1 VP7 protein [Corriparta virus]